MAPSRSIRLPPTQWTKFLSGVRCQFEMLLCHLMGNGVQLLASAYHGHRHLQLMLTPEQ
jgi:hypothetical protein